MFIISGLTTLGRGRLMTRIIIIGSGITGLAAAISLKEKFKGQPLQITVYEKEKIIEIVHPPAVQEKEEKAQRQIDSVAFDQKFQSLKASGWNFEKIFQFFSNF